MQGKTLSASGGALSAQPSAEGILGAIVRFGVLAGLFAMAAMAWTRNVNWDEFYFLSHVHAYLGGTLDRPLQTFFVHGFGWLSAFSENEVDQITAARLVMMCFFALTCFSIHHIAAHLSDTRAADIAVLAFVTSGFALAHGGSFRADPMAAGLLMGALALMMTTRMGPLAMAGVAVMSACALLVTVKSAMYLPVFLAVFVWRWDDRAVVLRILGAGIAGAALAAGLFFWHAAGITPATGAGAGENLNEAAKVTLGGSGFFPRLPEFQLWAMLSAGGVLLALAGLWAAPSAKLRVVLILFAVPLLSVVIYRNAFPYFFPFAIPPMMIAVALGARALRGHMLWKLGLVLMLASGAMQGLRAFSETNTDQRATIAEVHRLFPQPVPYIDQNGMVSSFERQGFFMSTWGLAVYRAEGRPVMADHIATHQPPLLLANRDELFAAMRPDAGKPGIIGLLDADAETLRASYVHHAGVIWLAGQGATLTDGVARMRMPIPGEYLLRADAPVWIDGRRAAPGEVLQLDTSALHVAGPDGTTVRLIWNTGAGPAPVPLPETGLYAGFWRL